MACEAMGTPCDVLVEDKVTLKVSKFLNKMPDEELCPP